MRGVHPHPPTPPETIIRNYNKIADITPPTIEDWIFDSFETIIRNYNEQSRKFVDDGDFDAADFAIETIIRNYNSNAISIYTSVYNAAFTE